MSGRVLSHSKLDTYFWSRVLFSQTSRDESVIIQNSKFESVIIPLSYELSGILVIKHEW